MKKRDPINYFVHWHKTDKPCNLAGGVRVFPPDITLEERTKNCSSLDEAETLYEDLKENVYVMGVQILVPIKSTMYTSLDKVEGLLGNPLMFAKFAS